MPTFLILTTGDGKRIFVNVNHIATLSAAVREDGEPIGTNLILALPGLQLHVVTVKQTMDEIADLIAAVTEQGA